MADTTIAPAVGTPALTGYIIYTDAATGLFKKAAISALKTALQLTKADVGLSDVPNLANPVLKTINSQSLLGSGNILISGGGSGGVVVDVPFSESVIFSNPTSFTNHEITGPITFTADLTDAVAGHGHMFRLVSDGTNVPDNDDSIIVNPNGDTHTSEPGIAYNYLYLYNGAEVLLTIFRVGEAVSLTTPSAPTSGVVDDDADTFGFTPSSGYTATQHEYTVNGGTSYADVTTNPISIGDVAKNIGDVGVRVKAVPGVSNPSLTLYNTVAFTVSGLSTPAAPTAPVEDDTANTFNFTFTPGFTDVSDYEETLNGGTSWANLSAKPIAVGNVAKAAGQVGVRVKAVAGVNNASAPLFNATAFNLTTPAAPTGPVTDDTANTFGFTPTSGFPDPDDYEQTLNGGTTWADVTANPISVGNVSKAVGQVGVRVKAVAGVNNASSPLFNTVAFLITPAAPTGGVVDDNADTFAFTPTSGFAATAHEYSDDGGATWANVPANPIPVGDVAIAAGDFQVRVKAVSGTNTASAALVSTDPFTVASSGPTVVAWRDMANATPANNGLEKTGGTNGATDAHGLTVESFAFTGQKTVEFELPNVDSQYYIGFSNNSGAFTGIQSGVFLENIAGARTIYTLTGSGAGPTTGNQWAPGNKIQLEIVSGAVEIRIQNAGTGPVWSAPFGVTAPAVTGTQWLGVVITEIGGGPINVQF